MSVEDPYRRATRHSVNLNGSPALWKRLGQRVQQLNTIGISTTRGELAEALWHYYTPPDAQAAADLLRAFRLTATRDPPPPPTLIHFHAVAPLWLGLGELVEQLQTQHDVRTSRAELTQAIWWRHLPDDQAGASALVRAYRAARLGEDPGAPS